MRQYELGDDVVDCNGWNVAQVAARCGNLPALRYCVTELGMSSAARDTNGRTLAHLAAHGGNLEVLKYCLNDLKLDALDLDGDGWTVVDTVKRENKKAFNPK